MPLDIDGAAFPRLGAFQAPCRASLTGTSHRPARGLPEPSQGLQRKLFELAGSKIFQAEALTQSFRALLQSNPTFHSPALLSLLQTSLSLPEPVQNEKVLLLIKMDLTEFRSSRFGWFGRIRRHGVGDYVTWPSTFRPWQHLACSYALEGSLTPNHHILHGNMTANPKP